MFKIYLKTAWRSITKRFFFTFINISGLALAISCSALLYLYINYQLSFDKYHKGESAIFRVVYELHLEKTQYDKGSSIAVYDALKSENLRVRQAALAVTEQSFVVNVNGDEKRRFKEEKNIAFTDSEWFKLFTYQWLRGSASSLNEPNTAALTKSQAVKYFGDVDPMGKIITINGQQIKIIGLIADRPYNTDLKSDVYISLLSIKNLTPKVEAGFFTDWGYLMTTNSVYVSLTDPNQKILIENELARLTKEHFGDGAKYYSFKLLPLKEQHFDSRYGGKIQKPLLVTLSIIGLLILIIASINYINITIATYQSRQIEVGTRKVLGGSTMQLFLQLMMESLITTVIAVMIAVIAVLILLPSINGLLFEKDPVHILSVPQLTLFFGAMLIAITVGTGIYPALMMSKLKVFQALKNNSWNIRTGIGRKVLIIIQNQVAQTLIACTIIIIMQVVFLKNTDKGFDRKSVVIVPVGNITDSQKEQLREGMKAMPQVQYFSFCNNPPSSNSKRGATVKFSDRDWEKWSALFAIGDSAYCHTFGIRLIAGRDIRVNTSTPEFLINETMAKMLRVKNVNDILGKNLTPGDVKGVIVGIVQDFNVRSLGEPIEPTILLSQNDLQTNLAIKLSGQQDIRVLDALQKLYDKVLPDQVFSYQFVDDEIAGLYMMQNLQQKLIWCAAIVAIVISSLGLLGLISLITIQRTKEIGIRKVLGASVLDVVAMLSKELLMLVSIAFAFATPIAYWLMHSWLEGFAFHISIHWWVFAIVGGTAVLIAIITVSFQSIKAALANPVNSLRNN